VKRMSKESTHIRIDKDLKQQLQIMARCDETINDVIRRLVNGEPAVNMHVNETVNMPLQDEIQALSRRVAALEEKESRKEPDHYDHPMITGRSQDRDHIKTAPDQEKKDCTYLDTTTTKYMITDPDQEGGNISISSETRSVLVSKLDELKARGLTYQQISEAVGMKSKGWITEVRDGKKKTLHEPVYRALMNL
jgi:hypothetical protein